MGGALAPEVCGKAAAVIAFALTAIGILMIYSNGSFWAADRYDDPDHFIKRQIIGVGVGLFAFLVCLLVPYRFWGERSREIFLLTALLLVLVLIFGSKFNGARRWLRFGGFGLQPSEVAKFAVIVHVSAFLASGKGNIRDFKRGFVPALLPVALLSLLFMLESGWRYIGLVGIIPILTGLTGNCPLYTVLGISTIKKKE